MREIGIIDFADGLENTFDKIFGFQINVKYTDCTHTNEMGCAVIEAAEHGEIDIKSCDNFSKIEREKDHFDLILAEKGKKKNHSEKW